MIFFQELKGCAAVAENRPDRGVRLQQSGNVIGFRIPDVGIQTAGTVTARKGIPQCGMMLFQSLQTVLIGQIGGKAEES